MKILLLGSGAREHALALALSKSKQELEIFVAPGNAGLSQNGFICKNIDINNNQDILSFVLEEKIEFVIVGPEKPLVNGITDLLAENNIPCFGPKKQGAMLEGSKVFSKQFMEKYNIPTAKFKIFTSSEEAKKYAKERNCPLVIKADGLAAGKGVFMTEDSNEAIRAIETIMDKKVFGDSGNSILVEEKLIGKEVSFHIITNGKEFLEIGEAQDHKKINDGEQGPNTGGMGAYSPVPFFTEKLRQLVIDQIVKPTLSGIQKENIEYKGTIFFGLMIVDDQPFLLEYNARFGDPECAVLMERIEDDLFSILYNTASDLPLDKPIKLNDKKVIALVLASNGYPLEYKTGYKIDNLTSTMWPSKTKTLHAGTCLNDKNEIVTSGGRVLTIVSSNNEFTWAVSYAYFRAYEIKFEGRYFRKDIGKGLIFN